MYNEKFLKTLSILYVEDSKTIRTQMLDFLVKLFKQVIPAVDGVDGLEKFKDNKHIDVVISDINMPNMDGIEMLSKIRELNKDIPFIFTTAYSETEYALNAIKYGVSHYAIKPINTRELLMHINDVCNLKYNQKKLARTKIELERYIDIVEQVAIISKTDVNGIITHVNDTFCEISKYSKDELIGQNHNIIRHPDMPSLLFKNLWDEIKTGKTWKGKIKNKTKNEKPYYINTSIFPICEHECEDDILEYISVSFLTTEEEVKKREFRNKVLHNIQDSKRRDIVSRNKIVELEEKLKRYTHFDFIQESFEKEKKNSRKLKGQINSYENDISTLNQRLRNIMIKTNEKISATLDVSKKLKSKNNTFLEELVFLKKDLKETKALNIKLNEQLADQVKIIENLNDVIKHRESQLNNKS